jgi:hypothetical protein
MVDDEDESLSSARKSFQRTGCRISKGLSSRLHLMQNAAGGCWFWTRPPRAFFQFIFQPRARTASQARSLAADYCSLL